MNDNSGRYLTDRKGVWHYLRRVPSDYAHLDKRGNVKLSTKIKVAKDPCGTKARQVAAGMNNTIEAYWKGLVDGKASEAQRAYDDALKINRSFGLSYMPAAIRAEKPITEVMTHIETVAIGDRVANPELCNAILGGVEQPRIMLSSLFTKFEATQQTNISKMSPRQLTKWTSGRKRSINALIDLKGDKAIQDLTRDDALEYSDWWERRSIKEGLSATTVNKNISNMATMIRAVARRHKLKIDNVFAGTRLDKVKDKSRKPFETAFIRDVILAPGKLNGLNDEARDFVYIMLETGARPPEIINLTKARIMLNEAVPFIRIKAEGRLLKTEHSERDIPLVGLALEAMHRHPNGFPTYLDNGKKLSRHLMKHFKNENLLPSKDHKAYSLRHSFKDRLKSIEAPPEMIDELMGHKIDKPKYGDGYGLQLKAKFIRRIAFTSPPALLTAAA